MTMIPSTPSNPAELFRDLGVLSCHLSDGGLEIDTFDSRGPIRLSIPEALALADFLRGPGVRALINRTWLAEQHAATVAHDPERRQKTHAGAPVA